MRGVWSPSKCKYYIRRHGRLRFECKTAHSIVEVDVARLYDEGKRYLILDIDNTVTPWRSMELEGEVLLWAQNAVETGFGLFILSNNHNKDRSRAMAQRLGAKWCDTGHKKPSKKAFLAAVEHMGGTVEQTVMIGDQLFSDVKGAKKAGIDGILLDPIAKKEAPITKLLRLAERIYGRKVIFSKNK